MILAYLNTPAVCRDWNPRAVEVAGRLAATIVSKMPSLSVEHIGSTAVPGCAGKGIVDLMVLYPAGDLEQARGVLDALGFQKQNSRDPWPEERPMRVGAIEHAGELFQIHAHAIAADAEEAAVLRGFRDRLRGDAALLAYVAEKRGILGRGVTDSLDYCIAKGDFSQNHTREV
jgi:GrpB-like predicted nucleotidyltransferase (UPF0157 family)